MRSDDVSKSSESRELRAHFFLGPSPDPKPVGSGLGVGSGHARSSLSEGLESIEVLMSTVNPRYTAYTSHSFGIFVEVVCYFLNLPQIQFPY